MYRFGDSGKRRTSEMLGIVFINDSAIKIEATRTGLEPATSGSTVRGSNQLSYRA